jgi:hypothetical protein
MRPHLEIQPCLPRWTLALWLSLSVVLAVRIWICPDRHTLFPLFASAAEHWWAGQPLYVKYEPLDYFRYPPVFAVFFSPFAAFGDRLGGVLWNCLSIAVYAWGLRRFVGEVIPEAWSAGRQGAFMVLGAVGALPGLWNSQSNALAVGLLLLSATAVIRGRWWTAALWLGASVWLKLTPLPLALLLCALHPRRLSGRLAVVLVVGAALPFLTKSPMETLGYYREWIAHLSQTGGERWPGFRDAWTAWLVVRQYAAGTPGAPPLREPLHSAVYRGVQLATAGATLAWCLWQRRRRDERWAATTTLAMGTGWLMLFGPSIEYPTYVFLTPFLAWAVLRTDSPGAMLSRPMGVVTNWRDSACRESMFHPVKACFPGQQAPESNIPSLSGRESMAPAGPRGRLLPVSALVLTTVFGWGEVARRLMDAAPVVLAALPLGTTLFILWLIVHGGRRPPSSAVAILHKPLSAAAA